jgi:hypothetical protein
MHTYQRTNEQRQGLPAWRPYYSQQGTRCACNDPQCVKCFVQAMTMHEGVDRVAMRLREGRDDRPPTLFISTPKAA